MPESQQHHSDARFDALAQSAPDAIITIDEQSCIVSCNPATTRIFGYEESELIGQALSVIIPERLRAAHNEGIARYLRSGRRHIPWTGVQLPALTKDGREIPVEISFGEFVDDAGVRVFSGFIRDVTERVRYEQDLEEARAAAVAARNEAERALAELRTISRVTDSALGRGTYDEMLSELLARLSDELLTDEATALLLDEEGRELAVYASRATGIPASGDARVPVGQGIAGRVIASGEPVVSESAESLTDDVTGEGIVSLAAVPIRSDGTVVGALQVGSVKERVFTREEIHVLEIVSERMGGVLARTRLFRLERAARESERTLRTLAQAITGAVRISEVMHQIAEGALAVSDAAGAFVERAMSKDDVEIVAASGKNTPLVGQKVSFPGSLSEEIIAKREPAFLVRMKGLGAAMAPYLAESCPDCSVLVVPLQSETETLGALVLLRAAGDPPFDEGAVNRVRTLGDLASISLQRLVALADSERRRAEAEQAVRSRDEVLSVVSHDLRNPVSVVAMSASLLNDPDVRLSDEDQRKQFSVIARSAQRMNRLIQDLLDVARIEGQRLTIACRCEEAGQLAAEVCDAFRTLANDKLVNLECHAADDLTRVYADRDRIIQALSNFLSNALKFTPKGGRIVIGAAPDGHGGVQFSVSDTGPGLSADEMQHVFQRNWQAKTTAHLGSGLGLTIAKGIAEAHRGSVSVSSEPGKGSTFYLSLPHSRECD